MHQYNSNHIGAKPPISFNSINSCYKDTYWKTNEGYTLRVLEYIDKYNINCVFVETNNQINISLAHLRNRSVKNPLHRGKYGGYFGIGDYTKHQHNSIYNAWHSMINRTQEEFQYKNSRNRSYKNVSICEDWYCFQNFAKWYDSYISQINTNIGEKFQLDKDILQWGIKNKIYSPDTCCIIPQNLNIAFSNMERGENINRNLPIGVKMSSKDSFSVNLSMNGCTNYFGCFSTAEEAFNVYKYEKEKYIKELADYYYGLNAILIDVKDAIYNIDIKPFENFR